VANISLQGFQPELVNIIQDRTLERVFHDALFPRLLFRSEAIPEKWQANIGERMVFTRAGLLPVDTTPLTPGTDPTPETYALEQWAAEACQQGKTIDTHMPTSRTALAPKVLRDAQQLGLQSGQTMNRLCRNALYRAYLGGNGVVIAAAPIAANLIRVASLNGFSETLFQNAPVPVSSASPLPISFPGTAEPDKNVIGANPDNVNDPYGPGTLLLDSPLTVGLAARDAVLTQNRSVIRRVGGGNSVDAISGSDIITLNDVIAAVSIMRSNNVPPHADGKYHVHMSPEAVAQLFQDNHWQRLHQSLPDSAAYRDLSIGEAVRCFFYENTENPNLLNSGLQTSTGTQAVVSGEIGGELRNEGGVAVGRVLVTGGGALYEKYIDESEYMSEAGTTGKIGQFVIVNNGVQVMTNRIRYIMRAPLDRLQQVIAQSWSWSGDFPVPSDGLSGGAARFKRAVVIEHAI